MTYFKTFSCLCACASILSASPAMAAQQLSKTISYADLDLTRTRDLQVLDRRVERMVERLCGSTAMAKSGFELARINACAQQAQNNADRQIAAIIDRKPSQLALLDVSASRP